MFVKNFLFRGMRKGKPVGFRPCRVICPIPSYYIMPLYTFCLVPMSSLPLKTGKALSVGNAESIPIRLEKSEIGKCDGPA